MPAAVIDECSGDPGLCWDRSRGHRLRTAVIHLHKEHCSAGISPRAYSLWCVSSVLFLVHAVMIGDAVFTVVQLINLVATSVITILVKRYGRHVCLTHLQAWTSATEG